MRSRSPRSAGAFRGRTLIVAETLERRIKDPRLGFVTITEVRITGDLREATVYYTVLGSQEDSAGTAAALDSARGVLRSEVGRLTGVRHTPTLAFIQDAIPENARYIEDLLERARTADQEIAAARTNATYAGDPDPYRHDDEDDVREVASRVPTVVCVHLEALNHCHLGRAELAAAVPGVLIPRDGETVEV